MHHFRVSPSQLVTGGRRVVLSFEALCNLFSPNSRTVEDFSALYVMRKTKENGCFFAVRSDLERQIVNLATTTTISMRLSSESLVFGRRMHRRTVTSFQQHGTRGRSSMMVSQSQQKSRRGSTVYFRLASTTAIGANCWIRADLLCP